MEKKRNNRAHYIRENYTSSLPYRLLFFDTETKLISSELIGLHQFRLGAACYVVNEDKVFRKPREIWYELYNIHDVYNMIEALTYENNVLHVYGSNISFDISACQLISYLAKKEWELMIYHEKGMSFILVVRNGKRKIKFLSMQNFIKGSIKSVGKMIGLEKLEIDYETEDTEKLMEYCIRDVEILKEAVLSWYRFVNDNDLGGHGITLPAQAFRGFRHRFMSAKILVHCEKDIAEFERAAYHGGRCECFRLGVQPERDYIKLDVNSMYPAVMVQNEYPTVLDGFIQRGNLEQLQRVLKNKCAIALVYIDTDKPVFMRFIDGKACFPIGRFWTVLTTRELIYAFYYNMIQDVYSGVYYRKRLLFKSYMDFFYGLKMRFESENNQIYRAIAKLFMNSLYGKFGEKHDNVVSDDYTLDDTVAVSDWYNAETGQRGREIQILHHIIRTSGVIEGDNSVVSIAAHVTADARMMLWHYLETAGLENVWYTDTDSLITTPAIAATKLYKYIGEKIGQLKVEGDTSSLELNGAKDYIFGEHRVLKGVQRIDEDDTGETYHALHSYSLKTLAQYRICDGAVLKPVELELSGIYDKGELNSDGTVSPFLLSESIDSVPPELSGLAIHSRY